jgi:hypothetical protein
MQEVVAPVCFAGTCGPVGGTINDGGVRLPNAGGARRVATDRREARLVLQVALDMSLPIVEKLVWFYNLRCRFTFRLAS